MNAVTGSHKEKESVLASTSLIETEVPVKNPETHALGEWIELGHKLRIATNEEILSFIGSVETYLEEKVNEETLPSFDHKAYVRGYAKTILKAAQAELRKRNVK